MTEGLNNQRFAKRISEEQRPHKVLSRVVAFYSAGIASADASAMSGVIEIGKSKNIQRQALYETMLQSFLILGFPRMINAAGILAKHWPVSHAGGGNACISLEGHEIKFDKGLDLCEQIYGANFEKLRTRITEMSPDLFHLMITEGYGKIYQRSGLSAVDRELANVSALVIDYRQAQLHSHIRGAINVGATIADVRCVVDDIGCSIAEGYEMAVSIIDSIEVSEESV